MNVTSSAVLKDGMFSRYSLKVMEEGFYFSVASSYI